MKTVDELIEDERVELPSEYDIALVSALVTEDAVVAVLLVTKPRGKTETRVVGGFRNGNGVSVIAHKRAGLSVTA